MQETLNKLIRFFELTDESGLSNAEKVRKYQKILRRVETTDKNKSVEEAESGKADEGLPNGIVIENGKIIGLGIHIFNEDVYPLKSFEISLRSCRLSGDLDISDCTDMILLDLYHNSIRSISSKNMPAMRIFGVQDNLLEEIDVSEMPACQGIDAGKNRLRSIDVSANQELR